MTLADKRKPNSKLVMRNPGTNRSYIEYFQNALELVPELEGKGENKEACLKVKKNSEI
jgi:hypothetical protein